MPTLSLIFDTRAVISKHLGLGLTAMACLAIAYQGACKPADEKNAGGSSSGSSGDVGTDGGSDGPIGEGGSSGNLPPAAELHKVTGLDGDERVSGIYCAPGAASCVIAANGNNARLAATTGTAVNATPLLLADDEDRHDREPEVPRLPEDRREARRAPRHRRQRLHQRHRGSHGRRQLVGAQARRRQTSGSITSTASASTARRGSRCATTAASTRRPRPR